MEVVDELPPRKRKPPRDWWAIARQLRAHEGKWVLVDRNVPRTTVARINGAKGMPAAMRNDPDFTYEAEGRDLEDHRVTLYVRATKRER